MPITKTNNVTATCQPEVCVTAALTGESSPQNQDTYVTCDCKGTANELFAVSALFGAALGKVIGGTQGQDGAGNKVPPKKFDALWREHYAIQREIVGAKPANGYTDLVIKSYQFYLRVNLKLIAGLKGEGTGSTSSLRALVKLAKEKFEWAMAKDIGGRIMEFYDPANRHSSWRNDIVRYTLRNMSSTVADALNDERNGETLEERYENFKERGGFEFVLGRLGIADMTPYGVINALGVCRRAYSNESFYNEWKGREVTRSAGVAGQASAAKAAGVECAEERAKAEEGLKGREDGRETEEGKKETKGPGIVR